jgi:flagellar hook-length control protein FliK
MSAPAINPAPSPTPGSASGASASGGAQTHGAAHVNGAQNPFAAFEAMLETLFGAQAPAGPAAAGQTKPAGKAVGPVKSAAGEAKSSTDEDGKADDGKTAETAAAGASNPNLALLVPVVAVLPTAAQATPGGEGSAGATPPSADGKSAGLSAALDALSQAAANGAQTKADAGAAKTAVLAAAAQGAGGANASATSKADAALTPKPTAAAALAPPTGPAPQTAATPAAGPAPDTAATVADAAIAAAASAAEQAAQAPALTAQAQPPAAAPREPGVKDKVADSRSAARVDLIKTPAAPGATAALTAKAADALQPLDDGAPKAGSGDGDPDAPAVESAAADPSDTSQAPPNPATAPATAPPATLVHAAALAVRGAPQTVANLAAQIVKKLDGRSSQFDIQLDPAGLGKVDVRVAIGADGRMSAAMSFDTPQAAAELKSRSAELQQAMEQAGFDLSGGMSFDVAADSGQGGQAQNQPQPDVGAQFRGRAFQAALDTTADAGPPPQLQLRRAALAGVDIRI